MLHRIERTRNRHSRAVLEGDTIVIRLARNLSAREEQEHIESLLRRMRRVLIREQEKTSLRPFQALFEGEEQLMISVSAGRTYRFLLKPESRTGAKRNTEGWTISVGPGTARRSLHRFLWALLCEAELPHVRSRVQEMNDASLRVPIRSVRLRYMTSQWGSCSARGDITLNAALLFLPLTLLDYVIVHELLHRKIRSHSARFWREMGHTFPSSQTSRKALLHFRLPAL